MKKSTIAIAAGVVTALALTACAGGGNGGQVSPSDATSGGDAIYAVSLDPVCLDPQQTNSHPGLTVARAIADSLLEQDATTGEYYGWLAETWEVNDDATEYSFVLRDGVTFSDGTPLTTTVIEQNIKTLMDSDKSSPLAKTPFLDFAGFEATNDREFTISFSTPNAPFLQAASDIRFAILSPSTLALDPAERCLSIEGTGPFVLDSFEPQVQTTLVKRTGYAWASDLRDHQGEAYLDSITVQVIPDDSVRVGMVQSGQVSLANAIPVPSEVQLTAAGLDLIAMVVPGLSNSLYPNLAVPQLQDPAVRQALTLAIDRKQLASTLLSDIRPLAGNVLSTSTLGYADASDLFPFDKAKAIQVLENAGWTVGANGVREKNGLRLSFDVIYLPGATDLIMQLLQQQIGDVGIELRLRPLAAPDWNAERKAGSADLMWQNATRADADILFNFNSTSPANYTKINNAQLDELTVAQRASSNIAERNTVVAEIQKIMLENFWAIPMDQQMQVHAVTPEFHGAFYDPSSRLVFYDAWLQK